MQGTVQKSPSWALALRKGSLNNAFLCLIPSLITHVIVQGEKREWDTSPLIHFWHRLHHQHHVGHPPSSPSWPSWPSPWSSSSSRHHFHHHLVLSYKKCYFPSTANIILRGAIFCGLTFTKLVRFSILFLSLLLLLFSLLCTCCLPVCLRLLWEVVYVRRCFCCRLSPSPLCQFCCWGAVFSPDGVITTNHPSLIPHIEVHNQQLCKD